MVSIAVIGAAPTELLNFRGDLIRTLAAEGHEVTAMTDEASAEQLVAIEELGADFIPYRVRRRSHNPLDDFRTLFQLRSILGKLQPDIVLAYTVKPIVWTGIALRVSPQTQYFAMVEGAGYAFQDGGLKRKVLRALVTRLYRMGLKRARSVMFLNKDNSLDFTQRSIIADEKVRILNGIGVDLVHYKQRDLPSGENPVFLLIARLLGEKGVREFAEAARLVRVSYPKARFQLVGPPDLSSDSISLGEVQSWDEDGSIEYLGPTSDVRPYIEACHVFVLPSYHEGMPRTTMEAMSIGRPILTTDVPGCRETVQPGENGFLVERGNAEALAERMLWLIENRHEWQRMGNTSRAMAEEKFDVHQVNKVVQQIMGIGQK